MVARRAGDAIIGMAIGIINGSSPWSLGIKSSFGGKRILMAVRKRISPEAIKIDVGVKPNAPAIPSPKKEKMH